jgi:hypothetical protein
VSKGPAQHLYNTERSLPVLQTRRLQTYQFYIIVPFTCPTDFPLQNLKEIGKEVLVRQLCIRHERFDVEYDSRAQFEQLASFVRFDLMEVVAHDGCSRSIKTRGTASAL